jgi:hypothetical protein
MSVERDDYREDRIVMRAVVDAYGSEERVQEARSRFRAKAMPEEVFR